MDVIYISHPYTGDEKNNRKAAEKIAEELSLKYPYIVFLNPLNAMRHMKDTKIPYDTVLAQCKTLLARCNGVIMAGKWKDSYGCMEEYLEAIAQKIIVWESPEDFVAEETMPNDCCGIHDKCKDCLCKECANRLECWNCNDCKWDAGQEVPIGYTEKNCRELKCSRYRKG